MHARTLDISENPFDRAMEYAAWIHTGLGKVPVLTRQTPYTFDVQPLGEDDVTRFTTPEGAIEAAKELIRLRPNATRPAVCPEPSTN